MGYLEDKFGGGRTKVWYNKDPECLPSYYGFKPLPEKCRIDADNLSKTHTMLGTVPFEELEVVWENMQSDNWSPDGKARKLIEEKGLFHTSMCVGDIVELPDGGVWMAAIVGFVDVKKSRVRELPR